MWISSVLSSFWRIKHTLPSRLLVGGGLLLLLTGCAGGPPPTPYPTPGPDTLYVSAGRTLGEISPYIFGTNYGPWLIVPTDLLDEVRSAGIRFIRFPGGEWGDDNDLQDYHIDPFIELARSMGAEPSISARLFGGTPEDAAALVRYCNVENDYAIRYWSIGNEPQYYDGYDTERFNAEWRAIAEAMLEVDPDILLLGPEITQWTGNPSSDPRDSAGRYWVEEFLEANGDLVDIVAIHRYPFPAGLNEGPAGITDLRQNPGEWDIIIPALRDLIQEKTGRDLPLAVTEINSHWTRAVGGEATPDSFYNAIWWADVLGRMINNDVEIVAQFALQSQNSLGGWGLVGRSEARPTFYVYRMYREFGSQRVHAASGADNVSVYAAIRDDGALTVVAINLRDGPVEVALVIDGFDPGGAVDIWRLDADHRAENIDTQPAAGLDRVDLPGQSMTLLVFGAAD
nr:hypothetical protein [Anaerolineae bacterium]